MSIAGMDDEEVWMEAEHLVAENIGNAKVRAFAREVLRQRQQIAGLTVELERQASEKRAWCIDANNLKAELARLRERDARVSLTLQRGLAGAITQGKRASVRLDWCVHAVKEALELLKETP